MKRLVFSKSIYKSLTPEQQAGLQNIGALIDQMLQSGQADVQQQPVPPKAPPRPAPPAAGAQPPAGVAALKDLEGDQKKMRIGGVSQNEGASMAHGGGPQEESESETERAPNLGGKMKGVKKTAEDLGQEEAAGFRGRTPLFDDALHGDELINAEEPAGKKTSAGGHPGSDATSFAAHRIGDLPLYDEEGVESSQQEGNEEGEAPGNSNETATKELRLLRTIARALNIREAQPVRKSQDDDVRAEVREVRKAVEYLIQKLDPVGARAAGIMGSVEKDLPTDRRPVYRNDATDDKTSAIAKALIDELRGGRDERTRAFGGEAVGMEGVRKALRESGLPALMGMAGEMWTGGR